MFPRGPSDSSMMDTWPHVGNGLMAAKASVTYDLMHYMYVRLAHADERGHRGGQGRVLQRHQAGGCRAPVGSVYIFLNVTYIFSETCVHF